MANNSVVTQQKLQEFYDTKIYDYLNGATHTGCVPLGTILPYFGETAPTHFLICDGTIYNKVDYPELAAHLLALTDPSPYVVSGDNTKFKVPDLRGEFLRGSGTNSHTNQGNGADVGVHQNGTKHINIDSYYNGNNSLEIGFAEPASAKALSTENMDKAVSTDQYTYYSQSVTRRTSDARLQTFTARPTNTSVTYIIAYRNAYIDLALDSFPIDISNPTDGQLLMWDATAGRWVNGGHKYSTNEHVVGTWIDGKPVYEKVIEITSLPTLDTWMWTNSGTLIDECIELNVIYKYSGTIKIVNGYSTATSTTSSTSTSGKGISVALHTNTSSQTTIKNNIGLYVGVEGFLSGFEKYIVIMRYTKTTDTV